MTFSLAWLASASDVASTITESLVPMTHASRVTSCDESVGPAWMEATKARAEKMAGATANLHERCD